MVVVATAANDNEPSNESQIQLDEIHPHITAEVRQVVNIQHALNGGHRHGSLFYRNLVQEAGQPGASSSVIHLQRQLQAYYETNMLQPRTQIGLAVFQSGVNPLDDPFAVNNLPIDIQQAFRFKLFGLLTLQLILVSIISTVLQYAAAIKDDMSVLLAQNASPVIVIFITCGCLTLLYFVNLLDLHIHSSCILYLYRDTISNKCRSVCMLHLNFLVAVLTLVSTIAGVGYDGTRRMISLVKAGSLSFIIAGSLFGIVIGILHHSSILTAVELVLVLLAVCISALWFTYDLSCMCKRLSPDEYMQGTIFFYTDLLLLLFFVVAVVAIISTGSGGGWIGTCACCLGRDNVPAPTMPRDNNTPAPIDAPAPQEMDR